MLRKIRVLIIFTFVLAISIFALSKCTMQMHYLSYDLSKGMHIYLNDQDLGICESTHLRQFVSGKFSKDDVITAEFSLPDRGVIPAPSLYFESHFSAFEIFIDDEEYKSYAMDDFRNGNFIGEDVHIISLPQDYVGKKVTIKIYPTSNRSRSLITDYYFGDYSDMEQMFVHSHFAPLLTGSILLILGLILLIISLVFYFFRNENMLTHLAIATLFILLGIMLHAFYNCIFIYADNSQSSTLFYLSWLLTLPVMLLYNHTIFRGATQPVFLIPEAVCVCYSLARIILHFTGIYYFSNLPGFYFICMILFCFIMHRSYYTQAAQGELNDSKKLQYTGLFLGIFFMSVSWAFIALHAILPDPFAGFVDSISMHLFCISSMFVLFANIVNFLWISAASFNKGDEYDVLTRVAYEDVLTGLSNRASADRALEKLQGEVNDYCIISLDVNSLKKTNDTYGHTYGDLLLKNFAKVLQESFKSEVLCARMGGDEFIVLSKSTDPVRITSLLSDLDARLLKMTKSDEDPLKYRCAYGYAFRHEKDSAHNVYLLADQRMYEHKAKIKNAYG